MGAIRAALICGVMLGAQATALAQVFASPSEISFGQVEVGRSAVVGIRLLSPSGADDLGLHLTGPFSFSTAPPVSLAPGQAVEIWIEYSPTAAGAASGTLDGRGIHVPLLGAGAKRPPSPIAQHAAELKSAEPKTGPARSLAIETPQQLRKRVGRLPAAPRPSDGSPQPGQLEQPLEVTPKYSQIVLRRGESSGSVTATVSGIPGIKIAAVTSPMPLGIFSLKSSCPDHAQSADTCTISATASPGDSTFAGETVNILAPGGKVLTSAYFTVEDGFSVVSAAESTVGFGGVSVGDKSAKTLLLRNWGMGAATITTSSSAPGIFSASGCSQNLNGPGECTLSILFSPKQQIPYTGAITIQASDGGAPFVVQVSGTGLPSALQTSPQEITFTGVAGQIEQVTLSNPTSRQYQVYGISTNGAFSSASNCLSLAPGQSCSISVGYEPTATLAGLETNGELSIFVGSPLAHLEVALHAAANRADISVNRHAVDFGPGAVGQSGSARQIVVTNSGQAAADVTVQSAGDFVASASCADLQPGASCPISLTFKPSAAGERDGVALISSGSTTIPIGLTGSGFSPSHSSHSSVPQSFGAGLLGGALFKLPSVAIGHSKRQLDSMGVAAAPATLRFACMRSGVEASAPLKITDLDGHMHHLQFIASGPFRVSGCTLLPADGTCVAGVTVHPSHHDVNGIIVLVSRRGGEPLAVLQAKVSVQRRKRSKTTPTRIAKPPLGRKPNRAQ